MDIQIETIIIPIYDFVPDEEYKIKSKTKKKVRFDIPYEPKHDLIDFDQIVYTFEEFQQELLETHNSMVKKLI